MEYKVLYHRAMPEKFRNGGLPTIITAEEFNVVSKSKHVVFGGEFYSVKNITADMDAEIVTIEIDNGIRKF